MSDKHVRKFYDEALCKDVKILTELLVSLSNSYRQLVGAAEEFNRITLVHRHEAEEAIHRADELGDIIDDIQGELKDLLKLYLSELTCKIELQQIFDEKLLNNSSNKIISKELYPEIIDKE